MKHIPLDKALEIIKSRMSSQYPQTLVNELRESGIKFVCVTGASRAGKDSFVAGMQKCSNKVLSYRFGDTMKQVAHDYYGAPCVEYQNAMNSEQREEKKYNGLSIMDLWIKVIDPMRAGNPYLFVTPQLLRMCNLSTFGDSKDIIIIVSGCRTELGLQVMEDLGATFIRLERPGSTPPKSATMDKVQTAWPVHYVVENTGLNRLQHQAGSLYDALISGPELYKGITKGSRND